MRNKSLLFLLFLFVSTVVHGQDPLRFKDEIAAIQKKYDTLWDATKETVVFTGSSSVRIWHDLENRFPQYQIVNSGFGGSQASDLLMYAEELILRFKPKKVFIYEGDNDISAEKEPKHIIATTQAIISKIREMDPSVEIVLIAAKPSIARWHLKRHYKRLNRKFKKIGRKDPLIAYADVWKPMMDRKTVKQDIFVEDGLHMNSKGYDIWYKVLRSYLD